MTLDGCRVLLLDSGVGRIGDVKRTVEVNTCPFGTHALSPDGSLLAASYSQADVYDTGTGKLKLTLEGCESADSLAFSPDGKTLATAGNGDGKLKLWNAAGGDAPLQTLDQEDSVIASIAFSHDGSLVAGMWRHHVHEVVGCANRRPEGNI